MELTKKELEDIAIQAELEAEEELKAEMKAQALEDAKKKIKAKRANVEASKTGSKATTTVMINLGKHADRITIDGRTFLNGRAYPMTKEQEATVKDMAFRTHLHQAEIRGKNFLRDFYGARPVNATI